MRKILLLAAIGLFLAACGTAEDRRNFWANDSMYKNTDHMLYSWYGYKKPTKETGKKSMDQEWWGKDIVGPPMEF